MSPCNKQWLMLAVIHPAGQLGDMVHACIPARIRGLTKGIDLAASRLKISRVDVNAARAKSPAGRAADGRKPGFQGIR